MRLFAAVFPPADAVEEIVRLQSQLQPIVTPKSTWVKPEQLHITLRFFGDVSVEPTVDAISNGIASAEPFEIVLDRVGGFPSDKRARVVFIESNAGQRLRDLAESISSEERRPHLTLARLRQRESIPVREIEPIAFHIGKVDLVNSEPIAGAHEYKILTSWKLT